MARATKKPRAADAPATPAAPVAPPDPKTVAVLAQAVEPWPIDKLRPYERNPKVHPPEQVAQIVASMREFGWTMPVLADETGGVIAGHGRLQAAREIGLAEVPVIVARGWSEAQKRAYVIADNRLNEGGVWDAELLRLELADVRGSGIDIAAIGYSVGELESALEGWAVPATRIERTPAEINRNLVQLSIRCSREQEAPVRQALNDVMAQFEGVEIR
jgi:hypothetical protein